MGKYKSDAGHGWVGDDCSRELGFICDTTDPSACGKGWEKLQTLLPNPQRTGEKVIYLANTVGCYFWNTEKKKWADAEAFCVNQGGHLASITSDVILDFLLDRMKEKKTEQHLDRRHRQRSGRCMEVDRQQTLEILSLYGRRTKQ